MMDAERRRGRSGEVGGRGCSGEPEARSSEHEA